jgi:thiol-disulfide isomerase/thioredoxin
MTTILGHSRRHFLLTLAAIPLAGSQALAAAKSGEGIVFHYFGAKDCPYCQAFVRDDLAELKALAGDASVSFVFRETASLRDLRKAGVFDELNGLWLRIVRRSGYGVPAFALVDKGTFVDSRAGSWRELLVKAIARSGKA